MRTLIRKIQIVADRQHRAFRLVSLILWIAALTFQTVAVIQAGTPINWLIGVVLVTLFLVTQLRLSVLQRAHERGLRSTMNLLYDTRYMNEIAGMADTRVFLAELQRLKGMALSNATPSVVVAVWLANLDGVRDQYGDHVGSKAVEDLATTLRRVAQGEDLVAYVGGGRFAIVLADCSFEQSAQFTWRIPATIVATADRESFALSIAVQRYDVGSTEVDDLVAGIDGGSCLLESQPGRSRENREAAPQLDVA